MIHPTKFRPRTIGTDMTPMIDVVFLLLVFFLYAVMHMVEAKGITLSLPRADTAETVTDPPLVIDITAQGIVQIGGIGVETDLLVDIVNDAMARQPSRVILIRADRESRTGLTVLVMSRLKNAGYTKVTLAVEEDS